MLVLVNVPFWGYWTSPEKVAMALTIYRFWLGDVQWEHLMTHDLISLEKRSKFVLMIFRIH